MVTEFRCFEKLTLGLMLYRYSACLNQWYFEHSRCCNTGMPCSRDYLSLLYPVMLSATQKAANTHCNALDMTPPIYHSRIPLRS